MGSENMPPDEVKFTHADGSQTIFRRDGDAVWLAQLYGLTCGVGGKNEGPPRACGLIIVDTDAGRFEDRGLKVIEFDTRESGEVGRRRANGVHIVWEALDAQLRIISDWTPAGHAQQSGGAAGGGCSTFGCSTVRGG